MDDKLLHEIYERLNPLRAEVENAGRDFHQIHTQIDDVISRIEQMSDVIRKAWEDIEDVGHLHYKLKSRLYKIFDRILEIERLLPVFKELYLDGDLNEGDKMLYELYEHLKQLRAEVDDVGGDVRQLSYDGICKISAGIGLMSSGIKDAFSYKDFARKLCDGAEKGLHRLSDKTEKIDQLLSVIKCN